MLDFDEILLSVKNPQIRKYLEESIKSYRIGNYRSAILAVWVATMFDLVKKFEILVEQEEHTAKKEWKKLEPRIKDHINWEQLLIQAAKKVDMISRYEEDSLESLRKTRNRYAHPSFDEVGDLFDPTPEEVRYFIRTLYDIVLSQPAQLGVFYVNQLLESIKTPAFFTDRLCSWELTQLKDDVVEKVNRTNSKQIPRLIKELFKALSSPISKDHELNILCFLINIWGAKSELQISDEISTSWDKYILEQGLNVKVLEGILNYPECINELSNKAQEKIALFFKDEISPDGNIARKSMAKFIAAADTVPLAHDLLCETPNLISLDDLIEQSWHYKYIFGDKFTELFGQAIFEKTREALRTNNGYTVNPVLSALRRCQMWDLADTLSQPEQVKFANELIASLNSDNWETMSLLSFDNREDIPIKWVKILLDQWSKDIPNSSKLKKELYKNLERYLGLVERYKNELGSYEEPKEIVEIIARSTAQSDYASETVAKLEANEPVWKLWQEIITKYNKEP